MREGDGTRLSVRANGLEREERKRVAVRTRERHSRAYEIATRVRAELTHSGRAGKRGSACKNIRKVHVGTYGSGPCVRTELARRVVRNWRIETCGFDAQGRADLTRVDVRI